MSARCNRCNETSWFISMSVTQSWNHHGRPWEIKWYFLLQPLVKESTESLLDVFLEHAFSCITYECSSSTALVPNLCFDC